MREADEEIEFRIMHNVFCEAYLIQRKAIAFDEYAHRSYNKYLLGLVTISPISTLDPGSPTTFSPSLVCAYRRLAGVVHLDCLELYSVSACNCCFVIKVHGFLVVCVLVWCCSVVPKKSAWITTTTITTTTTVCCPLLREASATRSLRVIQSAV